MIPGWNALGLAGKLTAAGIAAVIIIAVVIWIANWDPFGSRKRLETRAATAETQSTIDTKTVEAVDRYTHSVTVIREQTDAAVRQVQQAPGADAPIDSERRATLCAALASVRDRPVCTEDQHPAEPSEGVR